jgi:hypothetical protein
MTLRPRPLLVGRDDLTEVSFQLLPSVEAGDPVVTDLFRDISRILCYGEPGGGQSIRLIPMAFRIDNYYRDMVDEFVVDLGGEQVENGHPVYCLLARLSAGLVDGKAFSDDFRLDSLDALGQVLGGLKRAVESQEE